MTDGEKLKTKQNKKPSHQTKKTLHTTEKRRTLSRIWLHELV